VIPGTALGSVRVDVGQIEQVIMNMMVNARDAMPRGGKLSIATANVELDADHTTSDGSPTPGKYVMLSVKDTGSGMDAETQARIFEPFFTTKGMGKGTGLGLSTCYGIVKQSGGYIWVGSEPGYGTEFKIYLPRIDRLADPPVRRSVTTQLNGSETILLIEDDDPVRSAVARILSERGYALLVAPDGEAALALSAGQPKLDLVVSDVIMPGASGPEIVAELRRRFDGVKALFMSGHTDHALLQDENLRSGLNFIAKPFSPEALAKKVREVLDG
jgi:two-component system cell cycle sensor histidine kinase/response regulator CckA